MLQSLRDERFALRQKHFSPEYPLGRIKWFQCKVQKDEQNICIKAERELLLTFTTCFDKEFTCDSGHCVDDLGYLNSLFIFVDQ